jgi:hypothetical protein
MTTLLVQILPHLPKLRNLSSVYLNAQLATALDTSPVRHVEIFVTDNDRGIAIPNELLKSKEKILKKMWIGDFHLGGSEQFGDMTDQMLALGVNVRKLLTESSWPVSDVLECTESFEWNTIKRVEIWCRTEEYATALTQQLPLLLQKANMSTVEKIFIPVAYLASISGAYLSLPLVAPFPQKESKGSPLSKLQKTGGLWIKDYTLRKKVNTSDEERSRKSSSGTITDPDIYWPLHWEIYQMEIHIRISHPENLASEVFDWLQSFSRSLVKLKIKIEWSLSYGDEEDDEQTTKKYESVQKEVWVSDYDKHTYHLVDP